MKGITEEKKKKRKKKKEKKREKKKERLISSGLELTVMKHGDDDCFYTAPFSALE